MKKANKTLLITIFLTLLIFLILFVLYFMGYKPAEFIYQRF